MNLKTEKFNVRTRFAPSPTGFLHIGNLRTALYAYLFAKQNKGQFLLRIEDTDRKRYVKEAVESLQDILEKFGLIYDEGPGRESDCGPFVQSLRLDIYKKYALQLVEQGHAYYCFCSKERLEKLRAQQIAAKEPPKYDSHCQNLTAEQVKEHLAKGTEYVIRMKIPANREIKFTDLIRGEISFKSKEVDDQVLIKADGFPTYHLAAMVDDHLMRISHVIRGEEWLPSTPKHILLYEYFGWDMPQMAHLPLLLNTDKTKLSKRQNDVAVEDYLKKGYLTEALINFIALLGWNPGDDREIFSLPELIQAFSFSNVHKSGAVFNLEKLNWLNGLYLRKLSVPELTALCLPYFEQAGLDVQDKDYLQKIVALEQPRLKILSELPERTDYFFKEILVYDPKLLIWKKSEIGETKLRLDQVKEFLQKFSGEWTVKNLEEKLQAYIKENKLGVGNTLWPLRVALSGKEHSPSPFELCEVLGRERTLDRIEKTLNLLKNS